MLCEPEKSWSSYWHEYREDYGRHHQPPDNKFCSCRHLKASDTRSRNDHSGPSIPAAISGKAVGLMTSAPCLVTPAKAGVHDGAWHGTMRAMRNACVYILANKPRGTLYVGVTNDVVRRVWEHKSETVDGFTKRYAVHRLVYAEFHETMPLAIVREKQVKKWRRAWKVELIERDNPEWRDLYADFVR
jgi:putative endonuclease